MVSNFVFDWSGTLSDDFDMVYNATARVVAELDNGYSLSEEEYREHFELPYMNFYRNYGLNASKALVDKLFFKFVQENGIAPKPFPSAEKVLRGLRAQGRKTQLFSAHPAQMVSKEVAAYGFGGLFDAIKGGVLDKVVSLKDFVERHGLEPSQTAYVGDLVHDVEAAREAGVKSVGVFSRYQLKEKLLNSKPDIIIDELEELLDV